MGFLSLKEINVWADKIGKGIALVFQFNKGLWFKNTNTAWWPSSLLLCWDFFFPHEWYSSVLQVSKTKTTCHSYKLSIKINVPEGIERKKMYLGVQGHRATHASSASVFQQWSCYCCHGLPFNVIFLSKCFCALIKDIGSKPRHNLQKNMVLNGVEYCSTRPGIRG